MIVQRGAKQPHIAANRAARHRFIKRFSAVRKLDLPQPEGPTMAVMLLGRTFKDTSHNARLP